MLIGNGWPGNYTIRPSALYVSRRVRPLNFSLLPYFPYCLIFLIFKNKGIEKRRLLQIVTLFQSNIVFFHIRNWYFYNFIQAEPLFGAPHCPVRLFSEKQRREINLRGRKRYWVELSVLFIMKIGYFWQLSLACIEIYVRIEIRVSKWKREGNIRRTKYNKDGAGSK